MNHEYAYALKARAAADESKALQDMNNAFRELDHLITAMCFWGKNAKDSMGNFMPNEYREASLITLSSLLTAFNRFYSYRAAHWNIGPNEE